MATQRGSENQTDLNIPAPQAERQTRICRADKESPTPTGPASSEIPLAISGSFRSRPPEPEARPKIYYFIFLGIKSRESTRGRHVAQGYSPNLVEEIRIRGREWVRRSRSIFSTSLVHVGRGHLDSDTRLGILALRDGSLFIR